MVSGARTHEVTQQLRVAQQRQNTCEEVLRTVCSQPAEGERVREREREERESDRERERDGGTGVR